MNVKMRDCSAAAARRRLQDNHLSMLADVDCSAAAARRRLLWTSPNKKPWHKLLSSSRTKAAACKIASKPSSHFLLSSSRTKAAAIRLTGNHRRCGSAQQQPHEGGCDSNAVIHGGDGNLLRSSRTKAAAERILAAKKRAEDCSAAAARRRLLPI